MTEEERKTITQAVQTAKKRIAEAAIASGRKPEDITLVAATKMNDAERVRAAIEAGVDILLMPNGLREAFDGVVEAVESGRIPESRIDESVRRILETKRQLGLLEE